MFFINIPFKCNNRNSLGLRFLGVLLSDLLKFKSHIASYGNGMIFDVLFDRVFLTSEYHEIRYCIEINYTED